MDSPSFLEKAWFSADIRAALWLAGIFASPHPGAAALALWSWFLIQSAYFLLRGRPVANRGSDARDPFDRACGQLNRILAEDPLG